MMSVNVCRPVPGTSVPPVHVSCSCSQSQQQWGLLRSAVSSFAGRSTHLRTVVRTVTPVLSAHRGALREGTVTSPTMQSAGERPSE